MATTLLLIYNAPEIIQYAWTILNFKMLAQYILNDNKTLYYIEHALYRLEKTKTVSKHHWPINSKLYRLIFNYPKFFAINHFV